MDDPTYQEPWTRERKMAMTLLIMQVGFYTCAFFLSRSYVILLYIMLGLVTGWYAGAPERWAGLTTFRVQSDWFKWCVASRSEERSVGKECVSRWRSRWWP